MMAHRAKDERTRGRAARRCARTRSLPRPGSQSPPPAPPPAPPPRANPFGFETMAAEGTRRRRLGRVRSQWAPPTSAPADKYENSYCTLPTRWLERRVTSDAVLDAFVNQKLTIRVIHVSSQPVKWFRISQADPFGVVWGIDERSIVDRVSAH